MTDSVYTFKVIVIGTILGCAIGQNYFFQNYRITPRRNNKFYVRQTPRQPRVMFAGNNGYGFRVTQLPRGVFASRSRTGHPAFTPNHLGSLVGGSPSRSPVQTGLQGLGTVPALNTTQQDHQKLVDFLVKVIMQSQKRKINGKSTTPSPVLPVAEGSQLVTYTLPERPQRPTHSLYNGSDVPTHPLSEGLHVRTHIHRFQNLGSENSVSTVIVHSHGPGQTPHVHIVNLNVSNSPLFPGIGRHRRNTIQTSVPAMHQNSLPNPLMPEFLDKLPHFLTGGNKKEVVTKTVNTTFIKPTKIPLVPVRLQILPPSQSTLPTHYLTKPVSDPEEGDFEGAGDGPINSVTKISEPKSQIPSPRQEPTLVSTTPMTVFPATTPTTTPGILATVSPIATHVTLATVSLSVTPVTPMTISSMTTPGLPVIVPTTIIEPRATVSPTTTPTTPTTTHTTPTTEPIPPVTNLTSIS